MRHMTITVTELISVIVSHAFSHMDAVNKSMDEEVNLLKLHCRNRARTVDKERTLIDMVIEKLQKKNLLLGQ